MSWEYVTDAKGHTHYRRIPVELGLEPAVPADEFDPSTLLKDELYSYAAERGIDLIDKPTKAVVLERLAAL